MAEAWLRHLAGDRYEALSAGTAPVPVNPGAVAAMAELGIPLDGQRSKHIDEFASAPPDVVITVCDRARENCPILPGARVLAWSFDDPAGRPIEEFRCVRDQIGEAIRQWVAAGAGSLKPR